MLAPDPWPGGGVDPALPSAPPRQERARIRLRHRPRRDKSGSGRLGRICRIILSAAEAEAGAQAGHEPALLIADTAVPTGHARLVPVPLPVPDPDRGWGRAGIGLPGSGQRQRGNEARPFGNGDGNGSGDAGMLCCLWGGVSAGFPRRQPRYNANAWQAAWSHAGGDFWWIGGRHSRI